MLVEEGLPALVCIGQKGAGPHLHSLHGLVHLPIPPLPQQPVGSIRQLADLYLVGVYPPSCTAAWDHEVPQW